MGVKFIDARFPEYWSTKARGNDDFKNNVVTLENGAEQRMHFGFAKATFTIESPDALYYEDDLNYKVLDNHFHVCRGSFIGFRFRNYLNYKAKRNEGVIGKTAKGNGYPRQQLYKRYFSEYSTFKKIVLPSQFKAYINNVFDSRYLVDSHTGIVHFPALKKFDISSISNTASTVIITIDRVHNFVVGEVIYLNITNEEFY